MIKELTEQDVPHVVRLAASSGIFKPFEIQCVKELLDAYRQHGEASGYAFLIYMEGSNVLGFACFGPHPLTDGTFELYWIAVDAGARRRGIARALLLRVEEQVCCQGGRLILVETSGTPAYTPARRLYESCDYRYQAVIHDFYAVGDDLIVFGKVLQQENVVLPVGIIPISSPT
ncbi:MAG: GNAT family N-acetyltransferase [Chloroflexota bacterium]